VAATYDESVDLATILQRAGERVERYFTRAQSLVCLEIVRVLPLSPSLSPDGFGRTIESELRLSWAPGIDGEASTEAHALRQLLRVNGRPPRKNDPNNCTTAEQQSTEPQHLSMLLNGRRGDYEFKLVGQTRLDDRAAVVVDYKLLKKATVSAALVDGKQDCVSFDVDGGTRGRLWFDPETLDVLRLDQSLVGMVDFPLPRKAAMLSPSQHYWTVERLDTTIRFKPVSFRDPDETLVLPVSMSTLEIVRGAGTPRRRTITDYTKYQRFLTGARVVGE
jgi:hypothetical protein